MLDPVQPVPSRNIEILKRGFKGVFVAFLLATLWALSFLQYFIENFFGSRPPGILVTWPVHLSCASFNRVCTLYIFAFFRIPVSGIVSCHPIFRSFLRQIKWKWLSLWHGVGILPRSHMYIRALAVPQPC